MLNYIRAKIAKHKVEVVVYGTIASFLDNKTGRIETILNLIDSLKGLSGEDLKREFISALAKIVHEEGEKSRQAKSEVK